MAGRGAVLALLAVMAGCSGNIDDDFIPLSVTVRVSRTSTGVESNGASADTVSWNSEARTISADGRYVAFVSSATNMVPGDTNGRSDVFVRDMLLGTTVRASFDPSGVEFVDDAVNPAISADGRYVAFECFPLPSFVRQIYRRDLLLGITEMVSEDTATPPGECNRNCFNPAISADGRYVAFETDGWTIVSPEDQFVRFDVFVRDMTTAVSAGGTRRASALPDGSEPSSHSFNPSISADGRYVAFASRATDLGGPFNGDGAIYVRDMSDTATFSTVRVSVGFGNVDTTLGGFAEEAVICSISGDGQFVAFTSRADNLLPAGQDTNGILDVFVWSRATGAIERVSVHTNGTESQSNGSGSTRCSISGDGRIVAFTSDCFNLVTGDVNQARDIFVRDRQLGITFRASVRTFGESTLLGQHSGNPSVSMAGRYLVFESDGTNLVDDDLNGRTDVFLRGTIP